MFRTQVYLTEEEHQGLVRLKDETDKSQSEIIREAIDQFLESAGEKRRREVLDAASGMWEDRTDLPDWGELRDSWERGQCNE